MTPAEFVTTVLDSGAAWCETVPGWHIPFDVRARVLMLAIAGQESAWKYRAQVGGPARGFWQFEVTGVDGVLNRNQTTKLIAHLACEAANVQSARAAVHDIFARPAGDNLSVAFARLLLWSDPHFLPPVGNEEAGWDYYIRNWRPGKPSRERWATVYPQATDAILPEKKA